MPISFMFHLHHVSSSLPAACGSIITHRSVGYISLTRFSPLPDMLGPTHPPFLKMRSFSLHAQKEQIDLLASLGELFDPSSLSALFASFVLLYAPLLVNIVNSLVFSFNYIC